MQLDFVVCPEFAENVTALCPGTSSSTSTSANLKYELTDLQGSARALMNSSGTGTSTIVARHDYLPFGEEIFAGVGLRTTAQKYSVTDKVRQRFAMTERDEATGLDHTWFRKYDSFAGRWTSPDALSGSLADPQSFNHYSYAANDPVNAIDPLGLHPEHADGPCPPGSPCGVDILPGPPPVIGGTAGPDNFIPEDSPTDVIPQTGGDPNVLQGENNGKDCGIVVTFTPGTTYPGTTYPNGPSTITYQGRSNFGLGFSVTGWVGKGGIGTIGVNAKTGKKVPNPDNPKGRWSLEQWTNSWMGENGKTTDEKKTFADLPPDEAGLKAAGNTFGFYDHPGGPPQSANFARFENHTIKVYSGKTVCEVKFHFIQIGNTIHWGNGLL